MTRRAIVTAAARRERALRRAETELSRIAGVLLDDDELTVAEVALETGIARTTLHRRMDLVSEQRAARALLDNIDSTAPPPAPADADRDDDVAERTQ